MRMPWRHKGERMRGSERLAEAERAVATSAAARKRVEAGTPEAQRLTARLARMRETNHFAERLAAALRTDGPHG